jgi:MFS family permease
MSMNAEAPHRVETVTPAPAAEPPWPSSRQAWYTVFVFGVTLAVSFLDRGVLNLLVEPIKRDLGLTDTQMSLLMGFAFIAFYLVLGLPVARWIDHGSRRTILGLAATVWSVSTMLCGVAGNFVQLALCRVGVGAGDSAVSPAISSMISDLFPKERLARAMSIMGLAFVVGNGLALLLGGAVIGALTKLGPIHVPLVGQMYPWQATFFIVGIPGLLAAALFLTVKEPTRRGGAQTDIVGTPSLSAVLAYLWQYRAVYGPMFLGLALNSIISSGTAAWTPAFFERSFGWSPSRFGAVAGTLGLILSPIGIMLGFRVAEWLHNKGYLDANLRLTAAVVWMHIPLNVAMPFMPTPEGAIACMIIGNVISVAVIGAQNAAFLMITPNRMRGQTTALYLIMYTVIGYGLGPTVVALLTDFAFGQERYLYLALATVSAVLGPIAALSYSVALKPFAARAESTRHW